MLNDKSMTFTLFDIRKAVGDKNLQHSFYMFANRNITSVTKMDRSSGAIMAINHFFFDLAFELATKRGNKKYLKILKKIKENKLKSYEKVTEK